MSRPKNKGEKKLLDGKGQKNCDQIIRTRHGMPIPRCALFRESHLSVITLRAKRIEANVKLSIRRLKKVNRFRFHPAINSSDTHPRQRGGLARRDHWRRGITLTAPTRNRTASSPHRYKPVLFYCDFGSAVHLWWHGRPARESTTNPTRDWTRICLPADSSCSRIPLHRATGGRSMGWSESAPYDSPAPSGSPQDFSKSSQNSL